MRPHPTNRSGKATVLILFLIALVIAIAGLFLLLNQSARNRATCEASLRAIYRAIQLYEVDRGALPTLAYFPSDPLNDTDSLAVALEAYGVDAHSRLTICPGTHLTLRELGLTYIWNPALNGKRTPEGQPAWMLIEMTAIAPDLPHPHLGHHNVLYTDGSIRRIKDPKQLPGL